MHLQKVGVYMSDSESLQFAEDVLNQRGFKILTKEVKQDCIKLLARDSKTKQNESFTMREGVMTKLVHSDQDKQHPWSEEVIARMATNRKDHKSYIAAMREAVNSSRK